jgi:hypothetical protein
MGATKNRQIERLARLVGHGLLRVDLPKSAVCRSDVAPCSTRLRELARIPRQLNALEWRPRLADSRNTGRTVAVDDGVITEKLILPSMTGFSVPLRS